MASASLVLSRDLIFSNHLITDNIYGNLTTFDLLTCSLASRQLNASSREFLRRYRQCLLVIDQRNELAKLAELRDWLTNRCSDDNHHHPYSGISVRFAKRFHQDQQDFSPSMNLELKNISREIFSKLHSFPIKHVTFKNIWLARDNEYLSELRSENIEHLEFHKSTISWLIIWNVLHGRKLSNVKSIRQLNPEVRGGLDLSAKFLNSCPMLINWPNEVSQKDIKAFAQSGKTRLVKNLTINSFVTPNHFLEIQAAGLALEQLNIQELISRKAASQFFYNILNLIRGNRETLKVLQISNIFLELILMSNLEQINTLAHVKIWSYKGRQTQERTELLLQNPQLTSFLFPQAKFSCHLLDFFICEPELPLADLFGLAG